MTWRALFISPCPETDAAEADRRREAEKQERDERQRAEREAGAYTRPLFSST